MSTYVEKAIMQVSDQSSGAVKSINKELNAMFKTAEKLSRSMKNVKLTFDTSGIRRAHNDIKSFLSTVSQIEKKPVRIRVDTSDIDKASRKLQNVSANTTAAGGGNNGGRPRNPIYNNAPSSGNGRFFLTPSPTNIGNLMGRAFLAHVQYQLASAVASAVRNAVVDGSKKIDLAETRLSALNVPEQDKNEYRRFAVQQAAAMNQFSSSQVLSIVGELASGYKNTTDTKAVVAQALRYANEQVLTGKSGEEATTGSYKVIRALEISNQIRDDKGNLQPDNLKAFMDVFIQESRSGGQEMTAELMLNIEKYLKTSGATASPEGLRRILILGEDLGQRIATMNDMFVKQLTGRATKKALDAQEQAGLRSGYDEPVLDSRGKPMKTPGGAPKMRHVFGDIVDEDLLRMDTGQWVEKNLVGYLRKLGISPNDPVGVSKAIAPLFSNVNAEDLANKFVASYGEYMQRLEQSRKYQVTPEGQQQIIEQSVTAQFNAAVTQMVDVMGQLTMSFKSGLLPVFDTVASWAQRISEYVGGPDGKGDPGRASTVLAGGVTAGAAALYGGKKVFDFFTGLGPNTAAVNANTFATEALTAAMLKNAGVTGLSGALGAGGATGLFGSIFKGKGKLFLGLAALMGAASYFSTSGEGDPTAKRDAAISGVGSAAALTFGPGLALATAKALTATAIANPIGAAIAAGIVVTLATSKAAYPLWAPGQGDNGLIRQTNERKILGQAGVGTIEGGRHRQELLAQDSGSAAAAARLAQLDSSTNRIQSVMDNGVAKVTGAVQELPAAGTSFGVNAAAQLNGASFGAAAASAISAAISNIRVNVPSPQSSARPSADTGRQGPN